MPCLAYLWKPVRSQGFMAAVAAIYDLVNQ